MRPELEVKPEEPNHNVKPNRSVMTRTVKRMKTRQGGKGDERRSLSPKTVTKMTRKTSEVSNIKDPELPGGTLQMRRAMRRATKTEVKGRKKQGLCPNRTKRTRISRRREMIRRKMGQIKALRRTRKRRMGSRAGAVFSESCI